MAFSFMRTALKLGLKIAYVEEVRAETSNDILATLATPTELTSGKTRHNLNLSWIVSEVCLLPQTMH
ncbi:MAG: hypothetical protein QM734_08315 [Cyclobacteriaceae bacterium]